MRHGLLGLVWIGMFFCGCAKLPTTLGLGYGSSKLLLSADPVWSIAQGLSAPESAYYDPETEAIYVSNVAGSPFEKDGNGYIAKISLKGEILATRWASGLDAPKGLRSHNGVLYAADIDQLVEISLQNGSILKKTHIPGSQFLNDIAITPRGDLYISDTLAGKIFRFSGEPDIFLQGDPLEFPNGLYISGEKMYVAGWGHVVDTATLKTDSPGHILEIDLTSKQIRQLFPKPTGNLDGIESDARGGWFVSDWVQGIVAHVDSKRVTQIFGKLKGSADIGFVERPRLLIIPQMGADRVDAYRLR